MPLSDPVPNQFERWTDQSSPHVGNVCSVDPEQLYHEDRLGCARGVVRALLFEAALVAIVCYWKLHLYLR
jgi:hypothetical protein